ncbi:diguanylate cyclase [Clostridium cagae]|uniref:diguanylate cyclase n=1 Tax=Clostridium cagae TaxID=2080751 RepID=UPI003F75DFBB
MSKKNTDLISNFISSYKQQIGYLDKMPVAVAIIKVEVNEISEPSDFIFVYVNEALTKIENLSKEKLLGSSFYEVFKNGEKKWLYEYWETAYNGTNKEIYEYSNELNKFLSISCYQPSYGYCGCVLKDMSDKMILETENTKKQKRIDIILKNSIDAIFDLDLKTNTILNESVGISKYNALPEVTNIPKGMVDTGLLESESAKIVEEMINEIKNEEKTVSFEIKARLKKEEEFKWFRMTLSSYYEAYTRELCAVGFIKNVNDEILYRNELKFKADMDGLTEIYNAIAGRQLIEVYLRKFNDSSVKNAMFIFDIDNFKAINDEKGHYTGDLVLKEFAKVLKNTFHDDDIVLRLGGDEFVVFMKKFINEFEMENACNKIFELLEENKKFDFDISVSVGIAISNRTDARCVNYYKVADDALYKVKKCGKNSYYLEHF